jgi:hypothetical protein
MCNGCTTSRRTHKKKPLNPDRYCADCEKFRPVGSNVDKRVMDKHCKGVMKSKAENVGWKQIGSKWYCPVCVRYQPSYSKMESHLTPRQKLFLTEHTTND